MRLRVNLAFVLRERVGWGMREASLISLQSALGAYAFYVSCDMDTNVSINLVNTAKGM